MSEWISVGDRLPDVEGDYLVAWRSRSESREWFYMVDSFGGGDDERPSVWYSDSPRSPKVEYWLDFPRLMK